MFTHTCLKLKDMILFYPTQFFIFLNHGPPVPANYPKVETCQILPPTVCQYVTRIRFPSTERKNAQFSSRCETQIGLTLLFSKAAAECASLDPKQAWHLVLLNMFGTNLRHFEAILIVYVQMHTQHLGLVIHTSPGR